ncbi:CPBP family intramembrane glutamic endopeptidase [Rhodovulum sulfidophilum]|uniref:CPBP family intramembrane glutamic endopeptidase n=1 Tax=Rhodovulum sulfidophilum TaxID=35806 RepID=UPI001F342346|nr:CPBP family intramembrane glutamic endopeptidase [Rhodovulum sulfidophilum]MCE8439860.1 CPBP family intramembrane metalloprotease [Rhodovulum sulfidophilum]MCE8468629.1 CPBP family intramembrane metalloprotease [Rhodovulum sulfidophilum]
MRYDPHETLVSAARGQPALWRLAAGLAVVAAVQIGLTYTVYGLISALRGPGIAEAAFRGVFVTTATASDTLWLLASFLCLICGTAVAAQLMQGRSLRSLTGPPGAAIGQFVRVLRAVALLYLVLWVVLPSGPEKLAHRPLGAWLALLPLALPALAIQTFAEEMLFRGYLQQQLAARFRSPLLWIGMPALMFALAHYSPGAAGDNALPAALWAAAFSVAASDLTARSGTLGAAVALHFVNNAMAVLIVALPGPVSGLALYTYGFGADDPALGPLIAVDLAVLGLSWLAARVALRV